MYPKSTTYLNHVTGNWQAEQAAILQLSREFLFLHRTDAFRMFHCHTDCDVIPLLICISLCGTTTTTTTTIIIPCKPLVRLTTLCLQQIFLFQIEIWYLSNTINCLLHVMSPMKHSKYSFILKVDIPSSILILHYQAVLLICSMLHNVTANKCNTGCCLLVEGRSFIQEVLKGRSLVLVLSVIGKWGRFCGKNIV